MKEYLVTGSYPGDFFWPVNYPLAGALLSFIFPDPGLCLQIISSLSLSIVIIYLLKILILVFQVDKKYIPVIAILIATPFMIRFGLSAMPDMFVLALIVAGTYHIFQFSRNHRIINILIALFLFSIAVMSRYATIVIILLPAIYGFFYTFKQKTKWYWFVVALLVLIIPVLPHLIIRGENSANFISHEWIKTWSPVNFISRRSESIDGVINYPLPNIVYAILGLFHPRYLFLGGILILLSFRKFRLNSETKILGFSVFVYLIFLAGINYQNNRFLLLALPFVLIIFYPTIQYSFSRWNKKIVVGFTVILLLVQIGLSSLSFKSVWERNRLERDIYEYVSINKPSIYTMDVDISISGRGYTSPIYNIWKEFYVSPDTNSIIIFNTKTFTEQWAGKKPMQNWDHFNELYKLREIHSFNSEWKVYAFK